MKNNPNLAGVIICSISFFLLFTAYQTLQARLSSVFEDLNYKSLGSYLVGILYVVFGFTNFISANIVKCLKYKLAMMLGSFCYAFFMLVCIVPGAKSEYSPDSQNFFFSQGFIYFLAILGSSVTGFGAAIIWVGQGGYIAESSNSKNLGTNMGIFWVIFSFAMVVGFLITGLTYTNAFIFFIVMSCFAVIGTFCFCLLPKPRSIESENLERRHLDSAVTNSVEADVEVLQTNREKFKILIRLACSKKMLMLFPFMIHLGVAIAFYSIFLSVAVGKLAGVQNDQTLNNRRSSLVLTALGATECIGGLTAGIIIDKLGKKSAIVIQLITGLLGYGCLMVAVRIAQYNIWWFLSAGIYGICDSYGNTIINSILGSQFHLKIEPFAVFRFVLAISSGAFSFITPQFQKSTLRQIYIGFCAVLLTVSCALALSITYTTASKSKEKGSALIKDEE